MNGTVNPSGTSTSAYFQYGTTTSYGSTGQSTTGISTTQNLQTVLTGLAPGTTYHYRIVASNSGGTSYGSDVSFTTSGLAVTLTLNVHAGSASGVFFVRGSGDGARRGWEHFQPDNHTQAGT